MSELRAPRTITLGELRMHLEVFPDDWIVTFGCPGLEFSRTKARGQNLVNIEFAQQVYLDAKGQVVVEMVDGHIDPMADV